MIYDDTSLNPGRIRTVKRQRRGHNGIKNTCTQLGTDIHFQSELKSREKVPKAIRSGRLCSRHFHGDASGTYGRVGYEKAISATEEILKGEIDAATNEHNRKVKPKEE